MPGFHSFASRLVAFLLALMLPVLGGIFYFVNENNARYTEQTINAYLEAGARAFDATQAEQSHTLGAILSSLTLDFGFRAAYGTRDPGTVFDAALNVIDRSLGSVDLLMITDLDGEVLIDTELQGLGRLEGRWRDLLEAADASEAGMAETAMVIDGVPFEVMAVPLYLPRQVAWIIGGYRIDDEFLQTVRSITLSDVTLMYQTGSETQVLASTMPDADWPQLLSQWADQEVADAGIRRMVLSRAEYGTLPRLLSEVADGPAPERLFALIQRSYDENRLIEQRFRQILAEFYAVVLVVSLLAVVGLSRSISRPLVQLASVVRRIEAGDYARSVVVRARDELGQLADSINSMAKGLAEKEKVRDLLGKVVSTQIADELLRNPVELGGEERVVTVMFVDIKGFTTFCEGRAPQAVLTTLNRYLSHITAIIETHHGVVDKFNGDAVMALFGAPVAGSNDAAQAVAAALEIPEALTALTAEARAAGRPGLQACVGVNTDRVVAGNVGSENRLNYSVIGDGVNLAARLESLTRFYQVDCIVSEATRRAAPDFLYRELDWVRVAGKQEAVRIYEVVAPGTSATASLRDSVDAFQRMLTRYRAQDWDAAEAELDLLESAEGPRALYTLYRDRMARWRLEPPSADWQGQYTFDKK